MHGNQNQTHWAYIAGVMDSDGCFMITRHKRKTQRSTKRIYPHTVDNWSWTYMASVKISQVQIEAIDFIHTEMGYGTISLDGATLSRPNKQPIYQWGIRNRKEIVPFLKNILPYLKIKKHRAEFLLNYCETAKYRGEKKRPTYYGLDKEELVYREESYQKMRKLNGKEVGAETKPRGHESVSDSPTPV